MSKRHLLDAPCRTAPLELSASCIQLRYNDTLRTYPFDLTLRTASEALRCKNASCHRRAYGTT